MPAATTSARRRSVASASGGLAPDGRWLSRQVEITHGPGYDPCTELELAKSAGWTAAPAKPGLAARGSG